MAEGRVIRKTFAQSEAQKPLSHRVDALESPAVTAYWRARPLLRIRYGKAQFRLWLRYGLQTHVELLAALRLE